MKRKIMLDRCRGLYGFDFKGGADVGQGTGAERQRLRMMCLPALVLSSEVECPRVLKVRWKNDCLVPSFTRKLNAKVPGVKCNKCKFEVVWEKVVLSKLVEKIDSVAEGAGVADVLPGQGGQAGY